MEINDKTERQGTQGDERKDKIERQERILTGRRNKGDKLLR